MIPANPGIIFCRFRYWLRNGTALRFNDRTSSVLFFFSLGKYMLQLRLLGTDTFVCVWGERVPGCQVRGGLFRSNAKRI